MSGVDDLEQVEVRNRRELRAWLMRNHGQASSAWLVTGKKHSDHYLPIGELIEELLCFGWVDSRVRAVDADRTATLISPRNPKSAWSAANKAKVARLREAGLMTPAGEAVVAAAKANGMWSFLDDIEALIVPDDLIQALRLGGQTDAWETVRDAAKRGILEWVKLAKRPATRQARIEETVVALAEGRLPGIFS